MVTSLIPGAEPAYTVMCSLQEPGELLPLTSEACAVPSGPCAGLSRHVMLQHKHVALQSGREARYSGRLSDSECPA